MLRCAQHDKQRIRNCESGWVDVAWAFMVARRASPGDFGLSMHGELAHPPFTSLVPTGVNEIFLRLMLIGHPQWVPNSCDYVIELQNALIQRCQELYIVAGFRHVLQQSLHRLHASLICQR